MSAKPFFIVSSGRSGTAMLHKALSAAGDIEMQHEHMVHHVQPLGVRRYLGLADASESLKILNQTHAVEIARSSATHWGDSSNKLSWLIPDLAQMLPDAKFVHLVRDGRKVSSSYFHKLGNECYDDRSTAVLQAHYDNPTQVAAPPPEKKYWWPVPRSGDPLAKPFRTFDQFARIAWHWAEINTVIFDALAALPSSHHVFVRLEDLRVSPQGVRALFEFLEIPYREAHFAAFARPHNVNRPEDHPLTSAQRIAFDRVTAVMMERLGYADRAEYVVNY